MTWLSGTLVFIAGLVIAIRWLAAMHSIADLWYTMRTTWPVVSARVIGWSGVTATAILVVDDRHRAFLLAGMAFHGIVVVGTYALLVVVGGRKSRQVPVVE